MTDPRHDDTRPTAAGLDALLEARRRRYRQFGIDDRLIDQAEILEADLAEAFRRTDLIGSLNQMKVLEAFREARVSEAGFGGTTGYGYDDLGRRQIEEVYARAFGAEDALVRIQISSGTQAIALGLYGLLRPGDTMLSVTGDVYDTLEDVIGVGSGEAGQGSLKDYGIRYASIPFRDEAPDLEAIKETLTRDPSVALCFIQRSRGYSSRPALTIAAIAEIIRTIRAVRPDMQVMVDNCYGEFTETREPTEVGADLIAGSLIKNPGGGIAPGGGYVAGTRDAVAKAAARLTAPGIGAEVGPSLGMNRLLAQGFYMAPHAVSETLRGLDLAAALLTGEGVETMPRAGEPRSDIIQVLRFPDAARQIAFIQSIQAASPVDSYVTPVPAPMPGYAEDVIMAAGAFVQGSSLELSADGPVTEPWQAYLQGGILYEQIRFAVLMAAQRMTDAGPDAS